MIENNKQPSHFTKKNYVCKISKKLYVTRLGPERRAKIVTVLKPGKRPYDTNLAKQTDF